MPLDKPTVFVIDDDISIRESLELLIAHAGWQPRTFASAEDFLSYPRAIVPCCLVLDVNLPELNGLDLQTRVAMERADMPIIFITGYGDIPTSVRAMKAGAMEFLTKPFADDALLEAIEDAIRRSCDAIKRQQAGDEVRTRYTSLTPRERDVMGLVVAGLLNKQVGSELGITEITVKAHRGKVMQKMGARSLADLVRLAEKITR